jgi:hypothetical protein
MSTILHAGSRPPEREALERRCQCCLAQIVIILYESKPEHDRTKT